MNKTHERKLIGANGKIVVEIYSSGTLPLKDLMYQAFTTDGIHLIDVGEPFPVTGKEVAEEMDLAHSIKGHEPYDVALTKARQLYPNENVVGVTKHHVHGAVETTEKESSD